MAKPAIKDLVNSYTKKYVVLFSLLMIAINILTFYDLTNRIIIKENAERIDRIDIRWRYAINNFGRMLNIIASEPELIESEENAREILKRIYQAYPDLVSYPAFGTADGKMITYPYFPYEYINYDPRERPWYIAAIKNPDEYVVLPPFKHGILKHYVIAVAKAVKDRNGKLAGVLAIDMTSDLIGKSILAENTYVLDNKGNVIARKGNPDSIVNFNSDDFRKDDISIKRLGLNTYIAKKSIADTIIVNEVKIRKYLVPFILQVLASILIIVYVSIYIKRKIEFLTDENLIKPLKTLIRKGEEVLEAKEFKLNLPEPKLKEIEDLSNEFFLINSKIYAQNRALIFNYELIKKQQKEIKEAYMILTEKLGLFVENYDEPTGKHIQRVSRLSAFIAKRLGLDDKLVEEIAIYSPLHDIGKIKVPVEILNKPGRLTKEEFEIVKKHTIWGAEILEGSEKLKVAYNIALYHHERYDGTGYPYGLKGDDIPIEAQIVGIVDVYDALRSKRPYKEPISHEEAIEILLRGDDRTTPEQFSTEILKIFEKFSDEIKEIYDSELDNNISIYA
ncbi:MAG: cache domain-containing protein [Actinobacteria bacterium]|nr:cache domain-containing protein [Actinomycetota bacterium]